MKDFLKFTFASCLGIVLSFFVLFLIFLFIGVGLKASAGGSTKPVESNSILKLDFLEAMPEKTNNVTSGSFTFNSDNIVGFMDLLKVIDHAKTDSKIKGIYLEPAAINLGPSQAQDLLYKLGEFKESGKFVTAYADFYSQNSYYISSAADQIYVNPIGTVDFRGTAAYVPFFKDVIDKIGLKMNIYYAGNFKSATEPFRRNDMSPENKLQMSEFLKNNYDIYLNDIANMRGHGLTAASLKEKAYNFEIKNGSDAEAAGMVDVVGFKEELEDWMREQMEVEKGKKLNYTTITDYAANSSFRKSGSGEKKIAVVYMEGNIIDGEETYGSITDGQYVPLLQKLRQKEDIEAVVLRINSPGGSILAGEKLHRQLKLLKESGKKLIVSMGDYAASGGYYLSAPADTIFAKPNTLTGSIGVFSMIPNVSEMLEDKIGVHIDTVLTGPYSGNFTPYIEWSDSEGEYLQSRTDNFYQLFLTRVAEGRNMTVDQVHEVAQGRVWTGEKALELGLVDKLGDMNDAISSAANLAGLSEYKIVEYPILKNPMQKLLDDFLNNPTGVQNKLVDTKIKEALPFLQQIDLFTQKGQSLALLPFIPVYN